MNIKQKIIGGLAGLLLAVNVNAADYDYLNRFDSTINRTLNYFRAVHGRAPEKNLVKAIIAVEGENTCHDPMQIANQGDYALETLASGKEGTKVIGDFSPLKNIRHTQRKDGKWDYSQSNMTPEASIYGGVGWLMHKAANYANTNIISGPTNTYIIQKGDSFAKIAKKLGTNTDALEQLNPRINPDKLQIGQKVSYASATVKPFIQSWNSWDSAVKSYNGGGDKTYFDRVMTIKSDLDKQGQNGVKRK